MALLPPTSHSPSRCVSHGCGRVRVVCSVMNSRRGCGLQSLAGHRSRPSSRPECCCNQAAERRRCGLPQDAEQAEARVFQGADAAIVGQISKATTSDFGIIGNPPHSSSFNTREGRADEPCPCAVTSRASCPVRQSARARSGRFPDDFRRGEEVSACLYGQSDTWSGRVGRIDRSGLPQEGSSSSLPPARLPPVRTMVPVR